MITIEVYEGKDEQWYLRFMHKNTNIGLDSEGYSTESNAMRAARSWQRLFMFPRFVSIEVLPKTYGAGG